MFQEVQRVRGEREREDGRNMPNHEGDGGCEPANHRIAEEFAERWKRGDFQVGDEDLLEEKPRQTVIERNDGRAKKDEHRGDGHQEEMLDHVRGEKLDIERG
jgi:hypothetical protein